MYDAGATNSPVDCLNGLPGMSEVELDPDHDYPSTPITSCPANPTSGPGGGWIEDAPAGGEHYFSNVLSGDIGGYNSWAIDDDTGDGGQYHTFQKPLSAARVREAFSFGWIMRARARLMSCAQPPTSSSLPASCRCAWLAADALAAGTTVSAFLFSFTTGVGSRSGSDGFRYLPYICNDDVDTIGSPDPSRRNQGGIAVGEYQRPGATLPPNEFPPVRANHAALTPRSILVRVCRPCESLVSSPVGVAGSIPPV